jgi:hypothetical protein
LSPPRHRLLERQLRRALGGAAVSPELEPLLALVDETYQASDDERARYDRMLVLVSDEHRERNEELTLLLQPGIFGIVRLNAGSGMVRCEGYPHPMCGRRGRFEDTRSQLLSVVAPEDRERVAAELAPRDASGDLTTRFRVMRPEGTRWIELRARWTQERVQWAGVAIDVTSAVESSERQLAETRRYNQTILALGRELTDRWGDLGYTAARLTEAVARAASVARTTVWLMLEDGSGLRELDGFDAERGVHTQGAVLLARDYPRYFEAVGSDRLLAVTDAWTDPATDEFRHTDAGARGDTVAAGRRRPRRGAPGGPACAARTWARRGRGRPRSSCSCRRRPIWCRSPWSRPPASAPRTGSPSKAASCAR